MNGKGIRQCVGMGGDGEEGVLGNGRIEFRGHGPCDVLSVYSFRLTCIAEFVPDNWRM